MALSLTQKQARRTFLGLMIGGTLLLAGCQTAPGGPRPGELPGPATPHAVPQNGVAVIVPLTGGDAAVGQSIANAAKLALDDTGEKSLKITIYDSAGAGGAVAAATRAIGDGNGLILGPLLSEDVRAAAPIARRAGVPVISFSNDRDVAGNGVFIMGFTPDQSISRVVAYAKSRGLNRYAALAPSGVYGQRATQSVLAAVRRTGGVMGAIETYDRSAASVGAAARRLNAKGGYDAVLIADGGRIAAAAAPALRVGPRLLGTELWATDKMLGRTVALRGGWYAAAPDAQFDKLTVRYRARYGKAPFRLASLGYDAVLLAVRSARDWNIGRPFPAKRLIEADGFGGVDGSFRFGRDGIADRLLEVRQVTATGSDVIDPAKTAF